MNQAPLQSNSETENPLGTKIAAWAIALMIVYLVIAQ